MKFGPWYPLGDAGEAAPASPGVFQIKLAAGLIDYPTGKSAMIHYDHAADVRAAATAFAAAHPGAAWMCRHTIEMSVAEVNDVEALHQRLRRDFTVRFGVPPSLPSASPVQPAPPAPGEPGEIDR